MAAVVTRADEAGQAPRLTPVPPAAAVNGTERPPERPAEDPSRLAPNIYRFIFRYSLPQQLILLFLTIASYPAYYYSLLLPKTIVNRAISGTQFPRHLLGISFDQVPYLMLLCGVFLALVCINGGFKYFLNTARGRLGERMLRRFRYQLYQRMLLFPMTYFQRTSPAQIIPMITAECESLGGFIGDAIALPAYQGGLLVTAIYFMFMQDLMLGFFSIALYPVQGYVIPRLQSKVNQLSRQRVRQVRQVADRVQETATGMVDILANDNAKLQLAGFAHLLGTIYDIRFEIYQRKFFVKFLNNFLGQLTPFFFFAIGGYLVIQGELSFGALVAVLAAYKDMAAPWKELLDYYQAAQDSKIKYAQIIEQFQPAGLTDARLLLDEPPVIEPLAGELAVSNLVLATDDKTRILDGVTFSMPLDTQVAVVGQAGSGKNELALMLARLITPTSGRITIGDRELASLPLAVTGRRIGYVGADPAMFAGTLRDNLLLGLRHRPTRPADVPPAAAKRRHAQLLEARRSGNIDLDIHADWIDYQAAGVEGPEGLSARLAEVLQRVDLAEDVYLLGLRSRLDSEDRPEAAARLVEARWALARRLVEDDITHLVETYDAERYNSNASVAENLLFGTPVGPVFEFEALADNAYVLQVLDKVGLTEPLIEAGRHVAATMVEMFADLPPEHEFFEQFSFIRAADLPEFASLIAHIDNSGTAGLDRGDRARLLSLPFKLVAARHRLDVIDEAMQAKLLEARRVFRAELPEDARDQIAFFDGEHYNAAASVQDNILFGKIAFGEAEAPLRIPAVLGEVVDALSLRQTIIEVGLEFSVGAGGSRLSSAQRQKAALARAFVKRPDLMVLNEATSALDGPAQSAVTRGLKEEFAGRGIIWVLHRASLARHFDRILVMSNGRLHEQGGFADLDHKDSLMTLLVAAE